MLPVTGSVKTDWSHAETRRTRRTAEAESRFMLTGRLTLDPG